MAAFKNATESEIREYLVKKGMQLKDAPNGNFVCKNCPNCESVNPAHGRSDNLWKLYVLKDGGAYKCHRCHFKGSWYEMKEYFGDNPIKVELVDGEKNRKFNRPEQGKLFEYIKTSGREKIVEYFKARGIRKETLDFYGVGCRTMHIVDEGDLNFVSFPFQRMSLKNYQVETLMFKHRCITDKSKMFIEPTGAEMFLFGQQLVPIDSTELVCVEGEVDLLSVYQETKLPCVSLPNGANSLPPLAIEYFKRFEKIYLALDDDAPGRLCAENIAQKIGREKCLLVQWRDGKDEGAKDANEYLQSGESILEKIVSAQPMPHENVLTQEQVKIQLSNWYQSPILKDGWKVKDNDIAGFNNLLDGFRPGELTVLTARPGIGKSTCAAQLTLDLSTQGVRVLWGSFEIENFHILRKMMKQRVQKEITDGPGGNLESSYSEIKDNPVWYMKHHGETKPEDIIEAMEYSVKALGVQFIVIDNLQFVVGDHDGQAKFDQQNKVVSMLRDFKRKYNVHILLIAHTTKVDDTKPIQLGNLFGTAKTGQEIDNAIAIQTHDTAKYIETLKNRLKGSTGSGGERKRFYYSYEPATERITQATVWAGDSTPVQKPKTQWSGKKEAPKTFGADRALPPEKDKPF